MSSVASTIVIVPAVVIVPAAKDVVPPMVFFACHFIFRHFGADDLTPANDFLGLVGARGAILDGIVIFAQVNDFLVLEGRALAVARLLARRQDHDGHSENNNQKLLHFKWYYTAKIQLFAITETKTKNIFHLVLTHQHKTQDVTP